MGANAQTEVPTFTASQVLTAAQMNNSARTGVPVFATTTTRDAAFGGAGEKTLAEGQLCYIEASKIAQFYDGTNWRTLGPSAVSSAQITTNQTTSSTTYTDLATVGPTVTMTTGTSVFVLIGMYGNDTGNLGNNAWMSYAISGATTTAANDDWAARSNEGLNGVQSMMGYTHTVTAGSNTFTAKYKKVGGTSTAEFAQRFIMVVAL